MRHRIRLTIFSFSAPLLATACAGERERRASPTEAAQARAVEEAAAAAAERQTAAAAAATACSGVHVRAGASLRAALDGRGPGTTYCVHAGTYDVGGDSLLIEHGDRLIGDPVRTAPAPEGGLGTVLTSVPTKIVGSSRMAVLFVRPGARATLENLDVSGARLPPPDSTYGGMGVWLSGGALRRSRVHHNQGAGINKVERGYLVEDTEVFRNGSAAMLGKSAGGIKITNPLRRTGGGSVRRAYVHDNVGNGLWTDCGAVSDTLQSNTVVRNTQKGIFVEISAGPIYVLRNVVKGNNTANANNAGGITVTSSQHVRVRNNTLANNLRASINVRQDARAGNSDTLSCKHGFVPSDVIVSGNSLGGDPLIGCSLDGVSCSANTP